MGFYGNISNTSKTTFTFDKVYASRAEMEEKRNQDGVYVGRYVLIEYDTDISEDVNFRAYVPTAGFNGNLFSSENCEQITILKYGDDILDDSGVKYQIGMGTTVYVENDLHQRTYYSVTQTGINGDPAIFSEVDPGFTSDASVYSRNYQNDVNYCKNQGIQMGRGWDSTVWQKVYNNGVERYVMIAELNSVIPTFDIAYDAPTVIPNNPHFDQMSNNTYYKLHTQPTWGFRLKGANDLKGPSLNIDNSDFEGVEKLIFKEGDNEFTVLQVPENKKILYSRRNTDITKGDVFARFSKDIYDKETGITTTYYFDDTDDYQWSTNPYKFVKVFFSKAFPYKSHTYYYLKNNQYVLSTDQYIDYSLDYYEKQVRGYNAAIYFNTKGFDSTYISHSAIKQDYVSITPTGTSGVLYETHDGTGGKTAQPDTQELSIVMPSIGNTIATAWDMIFGGQEIGLRDNASLPIRSKECSWLSAEETETFQRVSLIGTDLGVDKDSYFKEGANSLAGSINTAHDLIGMTISEEFPDTEEKIEKCYDKYIYYNNDTQGYYRKHLNYTYHTIQYMYKIEKITSDNYYPRTYYISNKSNPDVYNDSDFIIEESEEFDSTKIYYGKYPSDKGNEQNYIAVNNLTQFKGDIYRREGDNWIYETAAFPSPGTDYYLIQGYSPAILSSSYEPNKYYYLYEKDYVLDQRESAKEGRHYYIIDPKESVKEVCYLEDKKNYNTETGLYKTKDENGEYVEKPLTYFYLPGLFKDNPTKSLFWYDLEFNEDGSLKAGTGKPLYDEIDESKQYYLVELASSSTSGTVWDGEKWIQTVEGWKIQNYYKVNLKVFDKNKDKYYFYDIDQYYPHYVKYRLLTEEDLKQQLPNMTTITTTLDGLQVTQGPTFVNYYSIRPREQGLFYVPNIYYIENNKSFILATMPTISSNGTELIDDIKYVKIDFDFYRPGKYYYQNDEGQYVIDYNQQMRKNVTYYQKNDFFIENDSLNIYPRGTVWNYHLDFIPATVNLATRTERYELQELHGFGRLENTLNGMILKANEMLEPNDLNTRNRTTVSGSINALNDIINVFDAIHPREIAVIDDYGRVQSAALSTDDWLRLDLNGNVVHPSITLTHTGPVEVAVRNEQNLTPAFGETFTVEDFAFDDKGHKSSLGTHTVKIPGLVYTDDNDVNDDIVTNISYSYDTTKAIGTFTETRAQVGTLPITSYTVQASAKLANTDTINTAFGKLQGQINAMDYDDSDANTTQFVSKVTEEDGIIKVERHNAGDLLMTGYSIATKADDVAATDNLNAALGKLAKNIKQEAADRKSAIEALDVSALADTTGKVVTNVSETDGKISVTNTTLGSIQLGSYSAPTGGNGIETSSTLASALNTLDARIYAEEQARKGLTKTDTEDATQIISTITQTEGQIAFSRAAAGTLEVAGTSGAAGHTNQESLNSLKDKIDLLNADSKTAGSVKDQISTAIASVVDGADASFDTLKEIANWINDSDENATGFNAATKISTLQTEVETKTTGLLDRMTAVEGLVGTNSVSSQISAITGAPDEGSTLQAEIDAIEAKPAHAITSNQISNWDSAATNSHTHDNKDLLDKISQDDINAWNAAEPNDENTVLSTTKFSYGDAKTDMTIQELLTKVAELETRIKALEPEPETPTDPEEEPVEE